MNDHDLLLRLEVRLDALIVEVKALNVGVLEKVRTDLEAAILVREEARRITSDHEARIRRLEWALAWATGALVVAQIVLYIVLR